MGRAVGVKPDPDGTVSFASIADCHTSWGGKSNFVLSPELCVHTEHHGSVMARAAVFLLSGTLQPDNQSDN